MEVYEFDIAYDMIYGSDTLHIVRQDSVEGIQGHSGRPTYNLDGGNLFIKCSFVDDVERSSERYWRTLETGDTTKRIEVHSFDYRLKRVYEARGWDGKVVK